MKIRVIHNLEDLTFLKEEWDELFVKDKYSVFQSFTYCYNSLSITSNPYVICLFVDNKINEIWPLEIINGKLRFINDTHADFCDILSLDQNSFVREYLLTNKQLGKLRLKNLSKNSKAINKLKKIQYSKLQSSIKFSVLSLLKTDSFPSNFTHFVYRQKRRLIRILKKFSSEHLIFDNKTRVFPIKEILDLRDFMIMKGNRDSGFLDNNFLLLAEKLYNSGFLIVSVIKIENDISAISLIFNNNDSYSFWVDLFDNRQMINLYHNTLFIKNITKNSNAFFNFGRGIYDYKVRNYQPEIFELYELNTFKNFFERAFFPISCLLQKIVIFFIKIQ